jgi:hypothetical protein
MADERNELFLQLHSPVIDKQNLESIVGGDPRLGSSQMIEVIYRYSEKKAPLANGEDGTKATSRVAFYKKKTIAP